MIQTQSSARFWIDRQSRDVNFPFIVSPGFTDQSSQVRLTD
jgi:hypothetical protein